MAVLVSIATGNFNTAATWGVSNATMFTDSQTGAHNIGTSATTFGSGVPGAITISGVAIKIAQRATSPSGTFTVTLRNVSTSTDVTSVTINVSDLPTPGTLGQFGWHMFKFGANQTLTAGQSYTLKMVCSASGSQVTVYSGNAVAGSALPSAIWVTTTTGAPATGDSIHIMGDYTGTGTGNTYTVTMDNTSTTLDIGSGLTTYILAGFTINNKGILLNGTTASTAYALKISTNVRVYTGGIWRIGQRGGTALPSTSTCTITMDCASDNDYRIYIEEGGRLDCYWDFGSKLHRCRLSANEAAAQTVLSVDSNTGWVNTDLIQIAGTKRTYTEDERRTVSSSTSTEVTISSGLSSAKDGTGLVVCEISLLTMGIRFLSNSTTGQSGAEFATTSIVDMYGASFRYFSQSTGLAAWNIKTTTGSFVGEKCSIYDGEYHGAYISGSTSNNFTIKECNISDINSGSAGAVGIYLATATSGTNWIIDDNWVIGDGSTNGSAILINDEGGTFTDNLVACFSSGIAITETNPTTTLTHSGNYAHTINNFGIQLTNTKANRTYSDFTAYRCAQYGAYFQTAMRTVTFDDWTLAGNTNGNMGFASGTASFVGLKIKNSVFAGETSFATTYGINNLNTLIMVNFEIENCDFGVASGTMTTHTSGDIAIASMGTPQATFQLDVISSNLASSTEVSGNATFDEYSWVRVQKKDKTANSHKTWVRYGTLEIDTSVFNTASPSLKMTPNSASFKLESAPLRYGAKCPVDSGGTITASVYVRKNTGYTGAQPRLIVRKNYAAGITSDTVLDTMTAAVATWEQLSGTTAAVTDNAILEFIVDCDGTAQYVSADDWSFS